MLRLIILLLVASLGYVAYLRVTEALAQKRLAELALQHGLTVGIRPRRPPRGFDVNGENPGSKVDRQLIVPATGASVFRHQFSTGHGQNKTTTNDMLALVPVPFNSPHLLIRPPTMLNRIGMRTKVADNELGETAIARRIGLVDMSIGHARFDETFLVRCDDERLPRRVIESDVASALIACADFDGQKLSYEIRGTWMLVSGATYDIDRSPAFLEIANRISERLPAHLVSAYPLPPKVVDPFPG